MYYNPAYIIYVAYDEVQEEMHADKQRSLILEQYPSVNYFCGTSCEL